MEFRKNFFSLVELTPKLRSLKEQEKSENIISGNIETPKNVNELLETINNNSNVPRFQTKSAIQQLGKREISSSTEVISVLLKALKDPDELLRWNAAQALRDKDLKEFPEAIKALIEALKNRDDQFPNVRRSAAKALGVQKLSNYPEAVLALIMATEDGDEFVRFEASSALVNCLATETSKELILNYKLQFISMFSKEKSEQVLPVLRQIVNQLEQ